MAAKNRKQVWLIIRPCYASEREKSHESHIYFMSWHSVDTMNEVAKCTERCYYYCNGLEAEA